MLVRSTSVPNDRLAAARAAARLTQEALAELANARVEQATGRAGAMDADYVSKLERGLHRWPGKHYRRALREVLGAQSDLDLGFYSTRWFKLPGEQLVGEPSWALAARPPAQPARRAAGGHGQVEVSWVDRRNFIGVVTSITLGVGAVPELERLEALLPAPSDLPVPRRIGAADVAAIAETTAAFRLSHRRCGGGLARAAAVAQLGYVLNLRDAECSEQQVRADLMLATADLANLAGWMTYDVEEHENARRLWVIALDTARQANHPLSTDLTVAVQYNMAHQALHLGRPDEALRLVQLGAVTATTSTYPVSAGTRGANAMILARCRASLGEAELCHRALEQAQQTYADAEPASAPPWFFVTAAAIDTLQGQALFQLAQANPSHAPRAVEQLRSAVDSYDLTYVRSRAVNIPDLAGSYFLAGEVDSAVLAGHEAVTVISTLSSRRAYGRLRTLADIAKPHSHRSDVAELRDRICGALAMSA
jgi:hypothetical protein